MRFVFHVHIIFSSLAVLSIYVTCLSTMSCGLAYTALPPDAMVMLVPMIY